MTDAQDDDWTLEWFAAEVERIETNPPPAPDGMELVECDATPRHWPTYMAHVDGMYPAQCPHCIEAAREQGDRRERCRRSHRRWKSWAIWGRISSRLYTLGITADGGGVQFGRCEFCGVTVQHQMPRLNLHRRYYVLGVRLDTWACLRRGHRRRETYYGLCAICCPCPTCGSIDPQHPGDCLGEETP